MFAPIRPSPTIPSSIYAPQLRLCNIHATCRQIPSQLRRVLEMNRAHAQLPRTFQIQLPVVNEQTFVGLPLGHFERQLVDPLFRLSDAQIAGTEKSLELAPQIELMDSAFV